MLKFDRVPASGAKIPQNCLPPLKFKIFFYMKKLTKYHVHQLKKKNRVG